MTHGRTRERGLRMNGLLASDTVGAPVLILFLSPIIVALLGLLALGAKRSRRPGEDAVQPSAAAPRSRWGLILALVPTAFGAMLLFFLLTVRGGAPHFFYVAAALPLLVGLRL